jgi:hypothetical protein
MEIAMASMDNERAARLLEKWVAFYGMNDSTAWEAEDYAYVHKAYEAMHYAIQTLRGHASNGTMTHREAARRLEEWPTMHIMDDPDAWEAEDFPFVRNAFEAVHFAAAFLQTH